MKNLANLIKSLFLSATLLIAVPNIALSQTNNSTHLMVQSIAEQYIARNIPMSPESEVTIKARELDARMMIPACPVPMKAESTPESMRQANVTVKVYCPSNQWFHYLTVTVTEMQDVVVLTDNMTNGSIVTRDNIEVVKMDKSRLRGGTFADKESVIGARLKRRVRAGTPVVNNNLCYVCKGDAIVIKASMTGLQIKTTGIAQQDGNIGEFILVKNAKSKKVINAQVTTVKEVAVQI